MSDPVVVAFLEAEVSRLEPLASLGICPSGSPLHVVEVTRREDEALEVRIPGRPPVVPPLGEEVRAALRDRGFTCEAPDDPTQPWKLAVADAEAAVEQARGLLTEVFDEKPDVRLDIIHGSHREEHEARRKLAAVRERLEAALTRITRAPVERDADEDYVLAVGDVHVMVAPRMIPGGTVVVRVFAITNVGITVTPELGLFLARLNFGLVFGRFALDAEHRAIFFDEMLHGDQLGDEVLEATLKAVASTADEWDDRLKAMYGGATYQDVLEKRTAERPPPLKPGTGGYA